MSILEQLVVFYFSFLPLLGFVAFILVKSRLGDDAEVSGYGHFGVFLFYPVVIFFAVLWLGFRIGVETYKILSMCIGSRD